MGVFGGLGGRNDDVFILALRFNVREAKLRRRWWSCTSYNAYNIAMVVVNP
jgi:hypothetical protein